MKTVIAEQDIGLRCDEKHCTARAAYIVFVHQIHDCDTEETNPDGDRSFIECRRHAKATLATVLDIIADAEETHCLTCDDLDITVLHNVIVVERLLHNAQIQT